MKRTPMLPRNPQLPSRGPRTLAVPVFTLCTPCGPTSLPDAALQLLALVIHDALRPVSGGHVIDQADEHGKRRAGESSRNTTQVSSLATFR